MNSNPFDFFISHASQDFEFAKSLCEELEKRGKRCWCGVSFYLTGLRGDCLGLVDRL